MAFLPVDDDLPPIPRVEVVRARIEDWKRRIEELYARIRSWLPEGEGYGADTSHTVSMNEPLMEHYGLSAESLPVLEIHRDRQKVLTFRPDALWVYPTNGRILIQGQHDTEFRRLIDTADAFQPARWVVLNARNWEKGGDAFDRDVLAMLLGRGGEALR